MTNKRSEESGEDDHLLQNINDTYDYIINKLLQYQRLFEYSGDILQLLMLPYNLFEDLIVKQVELRKKEIEFEKKKMDEANNRRPAGRRR